MTRIGYPKLIASLVIMAVVSAGTGPASAGATQGRSPESTMYDVIVGWDTASGGSPEIEALHLDSAELVKLVSVANVDLIELDGASETFWQPTDPYYSGQWELTQTGVESAWDLGRGSADITIAVLDTGVTPGPEFGDRLLPGASFTGGDPHLDVAGHGTAVASVAAGAANNGVGGAGVCPNCTILPVQVGNGDGTVQWSSAAMGIIWAADNGADVINMSFGGHSLSQALEVAVEYAIGQGVTVIAAAGNYGTDEVVYPAAIPGVISVGAHEPHGSPYAWSSYGDWVDVAAPGCATSVIGSGTGVECGTSVASPWVSGLTALVLSRFPSFTSEEVSRDLLGAASPNSWTRYGQIDATHVVGDDVVRVASVPGRVSVGDVLYEGSESVDVRSVGLVVDGRTVDEVSDGGGGRFQLVFHARATDLGSHEVRMDAVLANGAVVQGVTDTMVVVGSGFVDVPGGAYFEQAVGWMVAEGLTSGTGPSTFSPSDSVTRGQLATFLWRQAGQPAAPAIP